MWTKIHIHIILEHIYGYRERGGGREKMSDCVSSICNNNNIRLAIIYYVYI